MTQILITQGQRFGRLIVTKRNFDRKPGVHWFCQCDCGTITTVSSSQLKSENGPKSCGCLQRESAIQLAVNLRGLRFGRLVVIKRTLDRIGHGARWFCKCDCAETTIVRAAALRSGRTKSCGCLNREKIAAKKLKGKGHSRHPFYRIWDSMMRRCLNPKDKDFKNWGGRGITVYERWRSFETFASDIEATIGPRPSSIHSLHRIRNHGNYEPGNVKWATPKEQAQPENRRRKRLGLLKRNSIVVGDTNLSEACRRAQLPYDVVHNRIRRKGCTPQEAIAHFEKRRSSQVASVAL